MPGSIRIGKFALLATGIAILPQAAVAQKTGPPPGAGGNNPAPTRTPTTGTTVPTAPSTGITNGNIYLSGTVMLDDGTPPPEGVTIETVCRGVARAQAYTEHGGQFSFQLGRTSTVLQDASEQASNFPGGRPAPAVTDTPDAHPPPDVPDPRLDGCDLLAVLAGYRSDRVVLGGRRLMDNPNIGIIVLHHLGHVEGMSVSVASMQAPKVARKAYQRGRKNLQKDNVAQAAREFQRAVALYPKYAAAWYEIGCLEMQHGDLAEARESFTKAVAADPSYIDPYLHLTELTAKAEKWTELKDVTARLLKLDPVDYPMAYFYNAAAHLNLGELAAAEVSARTGEKLDPEHEHPKLEEVLAFILVQKKDYAGAAAHLRYYLTLAPNEDDVADMKIHLAQLERLAGANKQAEAAAGSKEHAPGASQQGPP